MVANSGRSQALSNLDSIMKRKYAGAQPMLILLFQEAEALHEGVDQMRNPFCPM